MRLSVALAVACLSISILSAAEPAQAAVRQSTHIPAQALGTALQALAKQRAFQVVYLSDAVDTMKTEGASGELTPDEALKQLLSGTGLTYRYLDESTVTVYPADAPQALNGSSGAQANTPYVASGVQDEKKSLWQRLRLAQNTSSENAENKSSQTSEGSSEPSEDKSVKLDEVIVTAQKREERLKDVPISISVLSGEELDKTTAARGVTDMLNRTPSVTATVGAFSTPTVAVRGVPSTTGASTTAFYLDSVPFGFNRVGYLPTANVYDLDRLEVLRGPQGTLYGASALNGVVRVLTKDVDLDEHEFKARGTISSTDRGGENYRGDLALNVPLISGKFGARLVAGYEDLSGWIDKPGKEDANDGELVNARLKLKARPTDALTLGASAWLSRSDYGAQSIGRVDSTNLAPDEEQFSNDFDAFGLTVGYDFPSFSLLSTTSYIDFIMPAQLSTLPIGLDGLQIYGYASEVVAQEINLNSTFEGSWRWTLGSMYRKGKDRNWVTFDQSRPFRTLPTDLRDESESYAVFGELTRLFHGGKVELTAGLRYFEDEVVNAEAVSFTGDPSVPLIRTQETFDAVTPRVVLTWHPSDAWTLYGSYSEGFRSGVTQLPRALVQRPDFRTVQPDRLKNHEIGFKADLWSGRFSFGGAVYYIDWQDVHRTLSIALNDNGRPPYVSLSLNGESASGPGVDFELTARPTDALEFAIYGGWNDLTNDADIISRDVVLFPKGHRLGTAEYTAGASVDYSFPLGSGLTARISAAGNYLSHQESRAVLGTSYVSFIGDALTFGRASFSISGRERWTASLYAENVNNEHGRAINSAGIADWAPRGRPRTVGIQVEYQF